MLAENTRLGRLTERLTGRLGRAREPLLVFCAAVASLAVHAHFMLTGLGESDAARFARIAFLWHSRGKLSFDEVGYQIRTSTLYLQLEKLALDHHVAMHSLPTLVNWVNVVFGTACSVALYVLFRKLTTRPVAVTATLIHAITPGFWLGNVFGMPTVPGLLFFVLGLVAFVSATQAPATKVGLYLRLALAWLFMSTAMTLKSDLALSGGAFLAAALARPTQRWRFAIYAVAVVVGGTLASLAYTRLVVLPSKEAVTPGVGLIAFLKDWNASFAVSLDALLTDSNNTVIPRCVGGLLFGVIVLSVLYGLVVGGRPRKQAILALMWALPPILGWGIRFGNSTRHNVPAFPPLILLATIFLFDLAKQDTRRATALVVALMGLSYFSNTSGEEALKPQSNLLALTAVVERRTQNTHARARDLAQSPGQKRVVIAGYADAWTEFEVLSDGQNPKIGDSTDHMTIIDGERITIIDYDAYLGHKSAKAMARRYRAQGYEILSLSYRL